MSHRKLWPGGVSLKASIPAPGPLPACWHLGREHGEEGYTQQLHYKEHQGAEMIAF